LEHEHRHSTFVSHIPSVEIVPFVDVHPEMFIPLNVSIIVGENTPLLLVDKPNSPMIVWEIPSCPQSSRPNDFTCPFENVAIE